MDNTYREIFTVLMISTALVRHRLRVRFQNKIEFQTLRSKNPYSTGNKKIKSFLPEFAVFVGLTCVLRTGLAEIFNERAIVSLRSGLPQYLACIALKKIVINSYFGTNEMEHTCRKSK